jgi:hypothetical protein
VSAEQYRLRAEGICRGWIHQQNVAWKYVVPAIADALQAERDRALTRKWGPIKVPESLKSGLTPDQERDLRIIVEDRRVTDLSADYWMNEARNVQQKLQSERDARQRPL